MTAEEFIKYVSDRFSVDADYPFEADDVYVFRHTENRKWFAIVMTVPYERFGLKKPGSVQVVNTKCGPLLMDAFRKLNGIYPAYHMNKDNWVTALLDGSAEDDTIGELLEISWELTKGRKRKR